MGTTATMFFQDLGPQLGWAMVREENPPMLFLSVSPAMVEAYLIQYSSLFTWTGVPDGEHRATPHLPPVLLPPALHLQSGIQLHCQSAQSGQVGCGAVL